MIKSDFNRGWLFQKEGHPEVIEVNLPHDAMIHEQRTKDSKAAGACGYFQPGKYTYRKKWYVEEASSAGKTFLLECEGVYQNASVFLNNKLLCTHPYGYTNFYVNLTPALLPNQENELCIVADNEKAPNSRWYSGSGIYREVHMYEGPRLSIAPDGIRVSTLTSDSVSVSVDLLLDGAFFDAAEAARLIPAPTLLIQIWDHGTLIAEASQSPAIIPIPNAHLWSEEDPYLYECRVSLMEGEQEADRSESRFGMRIISWGREGLMVNGKRVLLRGACVHHDNGILGACAFRDAEYRRVRIMKEAGFNAVRSAHNPVSKAMLDACDELGLYVVDEAFDMWMIQKNPYDYGNETFRSWWRTDIKAMISKDYNHPSVIMYSLGNEISDLGKEDGQRLCREMSAYVRSIDPSRAVTLGINLILASLTSKGKGLYGQNKDGSVSSPGAQTMDSAPTSEFFNILMNKLGGIMEMMSNTRSADRIAAAVSKELDIPGYNYAGVRYHKEAKARPDKAFVGSETLPKSLCRNWRMVQDIPQLIGDFMWTGWDYLGEAGIGTVKYSDRKTKAPINPGLAILGGCGVIDICGKKRPEVNWNKIIWGLSSAPAIGVEPMTHSGHLAGISMWRNTDAVESWSWDGCEGKKNTVIVYADGARAELIINGKRVGRKPIKEYKAIFKNVVYEPGEIEALIYDAGNILCGRTSLCSASEKTCIRLNADRTRLHANGQDLCFINIQLTDEKGILKASSDQRLTVKVCGAGSLEAYGSAHPCPSESYHDHTHTTYLGNALAIVRAGYRAGRITVTVSAGEEPEPAVLHINVE